MFPNLGLEPTPELHIEHMVGIFREIHRVLRDDGVVYLNYGDCYSNTTKGGTLEFGNPEFNIGRPSRQATKLPPKTATIPQGNLMLMPHKVAIALQNDGWIVRNDVVWWKRNPMPESVAGWRWEARSCECAKTRIRATNRYMQEAYQGQGHGAVIGPRKQREDALLNPGDPDCPECHGTGKVGDPVLRKGSWRHTRAHEYIFQLVKKMNYYSNQEAVREANSPSTIEWHGDGSETKRVHGDSKFARSRGGLFSVGATSSGRNPRSVLEVSTDSMDAFYHWLAERMGVDLYEAIEAFRQEVTNPNDVLDVPTSPYKGAHYATFPPNLIAPLIRASCPKRCCPECGAPWAPVVEKQPTGATQKMADGWDTGDGAHGTIHRDGREQGESGKPILQSNVTDYRPTCSCDCGDHIPGIVLDPFIGSGTTGAVARELGRRWIGLDISMEYLDQQAKIRALNWTPSNALDNLPLFADFPNE